MKRKLTIAGVSLLAIAALLILVGQTVVITAGPEVLLEWDPVSTFDDGTPIPAEDTVEYEIRLDGEAAGATAQTSLPLTLDNQGQHTFEVRTVLTRSSGEVSTSDYASLSVVILYRPKMPERLRISGR